MIDEIVDVKFLKTCHAILILFFVLFLQYYFHSFKMFDIVEVSSSFFDVLSRIENVI